MRLCTPSRLIRQKSYMVSTGISSGLFATRFSFCRPPADSVPKVPDTHAPHIPSFGKPPSRRRTLLGALPSRLLRRALCSPSSLRSPLAFFGAVPARVLRSAVILPSSLRSRLAFFEALSALLLRSAVCLPSSARSLLALGDALCARPFRRAPLLAFFGALPGRLPRRAFSSFYTLVAQPSFDLLVSLSCSFLFRLL